MSQPTTPTTPTAPSSELAKAPPTLDELLASVVTAIADASDGNDLPGGARTLPFFEQLLTDCRARSASDETPDSAVFWARIGELCPPILEAWSAWRSDPSDDACAAIKNAVMAF